MKKLFLIFIVFITVSCNSDNSEQRGKIDASTSSHLKTLTHSVIGKKKGNDITLSISNDKLLQIFREDSRRNDLEINPISCKIEKINDKDYLRFYNDDETVSTIELLIDADRNVSTGSTVCTSNAFAGGGGCIPDGLYCTKLIPDGADTSLLGEDCKRTTTALIADLK